MKRAVQNQKSLIIEILAASFDDNKSVNFVVMQDMSRKERIEGLMEYSFNICNAFGDVWISEDEQAALWFSYLTRKRPSSILSYGMSG